MIARIALPFAVAAAVLVGSIDTVSANRCTNRRGRRPPSSHFKSTPAQTVWPFPSPTYARADLFLVDNIVVARWYDHQHRRAFPDGGDPNSDLWWRAQILCFDFDPFDRNEISNWMKNDVNGDFRVTEADGIWCSDAWLPAIFDDGETIEGPQGSTPFSCVDCPSGMHPYRGRVQVASRAYPWFFTGI